MKRLALPLWVVALLTISTSAQSFTNSSGSCHVYKITNGTVEYYCYGVPVTYNDGTTGSLSFTSFFNTDGTFSGTVYRDGYTYAGDLSGTFTGPQATPTSLSGKFTGGSITMENFAVRKGPCYKGTCQSSPYVMNGSGVFL
jgi:hypothetical protein